MIFALCTITAGAIIVILALREIFKDLFDPTARGSLSSFVPRALTRLLRRRPSLLPAAGPVALIMIIGCWVGLLALGFALIYWPSFPQDFRIDSGKTPAQEHGFLPVLYFAFEIIGDLGLGDFTPQRGWMRMLVTVQALIGLGLVTASISWIVLLYPALARMRTLARRTGLLITAAQETGVDVVTNGGEHLLNQLALDVIRTRVDLIHFPIIFYFFSSHKLSSLAHAIPQLVDFAERASKAKDADAVRLGGALLRTALDDLAVVLGDRFVQAGSRDTEAVFRAWRDYQFTAD